MEGDVYKRQLLHGGTCNELDWIYSGRLPYLLDNLIAGGKIAPFLVVMNNGICLLYTSRCV